MTTDRGNFIGNINRTKQPGDNRPLFRGRIGLPGTDKEYVFALIPIITITHQRNEPHEERHR